MPYRSVRAGVSGYKPSFSTLGLLTLVACGGGDGGEPARPAIASAEFVQMASTAMCANLRNRLFVIDQKYVFWDKAGSCADAAYAQTLFGATPQAVLCSQADSIAGPQTRCPDAQHAALMQTITQNLEKADLGLGAGHQVQPLSVPAAAPTALPFAAMTPRFFRGTTPGSMMIRDAITWKDFLRSQTDSGQPVFPEPDFSRQMVLAVFSRTANSCNLTRIVGVSSNGQQLAVEFVDQERMTLQACEPAGATPMSLVLLDAMALPVQFANITASLLPFRTLEQSSHSAITTPQTSVLKESSAWSQLWGEHRGKSQSGEVLPVVDFSSRIVAAVFLGSQPSGCHGIGDLTVWRSQGSIHVAHHDTVPGPTVLCTAVITTPAAMIEIEHSEAPVKFIAIPTPL